MRASLSPKVMLVSVVDKRGELRIGLKDHTSPIAAVTTIRTTFGHVRFSAKRHASGPAVTTTNVDT
jgi:hypothetical protein